MIIPDVNLLVYAYDKTSPFHDASREWWQQAVNGEEGVGLPWAVVVGFLRLVTHPRVFATPVNIDDALSVVNDWMRQRNVVLIEPGSQHWSLVVEFLRQVRLGGKLVNDAHLAALAREYRAELCTNDRDFERFSGLLLRNPLAKV